MDMNIWECVRCGKCCMENWDFIFASVEDLERWKREGRKDLLAMTRPIYKGEEGKPRTAGFRKQPQGRLVAADIWFNPETGRKYRQCPFFESKGKKAGCRIHKTKPRVCRDYICREHLKAVR